MFRSVIVKDGDALKIIKVPRGTMPSGFLRNAPPGWGPGDEIYIKKLDNGLLDFDFSSQEKKATVVMKKKSWNHKGILARLKRSFIK